jgi:hypothetical protein
VLQRKGHRLRQFGRCGGSREEHTSCSLTPKDGRRRPLIISAENSEVVPNAHCRPRHSSKKKWSNRQRVAGIRKAGGRRFSGTRLRFCRAQRGSPRGSGRELVANRRLRRGGQIANLPEEKARCPRSEPACELVERLAPRTPAPGVLEVTRRGTRVERFSATRRHITHPALLHRRASMECGLGA